eukprot:TRINITY_DN16966_c0_g1::TRINITY_DN16966_c0_g1_i1::g.13132::m.13132 TRINITY_DN16966_c0_g1::TRINITY_DN16966_c0_g1_i1::g.13132  ORF type:complete len:114 (+),score=-2.93,DUF4632/PF15451.1/0.0054 TRINITY_DN16966_c0_g1_i1:143-484(+)
MAVLLHLMFPEVRLRVLRCPFRNWQGMKEEKEARPDRYRSRYVRRLWLWNLQPGLKWRRQIPGALYHMILLVLNCLLGQVQNRKEWTEGLEVSRVEKSQSASLLSMLERLLGQ